MTGCPLSRGAVPSKPISERRDAEGPRALSPGVIARVPIAEDVWDLRVWGSHGVLRLNGWLPVRYLVMWWRGYDSLKRGFQSFVAARAGANRKGRD